MTAAADLSHADRDRRRVAHIFADLIGSPAARCQWRNGTVLRSIAATGHPVSGGEPA